MCLHSTVLRGFPIKSTSREVPPKISKAKSKLSKQRSATYLLFSFPFSGSFLYKSVFFLTGYVYNF